MSSEKPFRLRVKVKDGKPTDWRKVKTKLVPHVDVLDAKGGVEFVVCAGKDSHREEVRSRLAAAGLEEMPGGDTEVAPPQRASVRQPGRRQQNAAAARPSPTPLKPKPYGFVAVPDNILTEAPVWHDGAMSNGRLSGEIRCELETLTPLLVGWERSNANDEDRPRPVKGEPAKSGPVRVQIDDMTEPIEIEKGKSLLCPLRAPWGEKPVLIPGDSIKGLLRHELGALLGAPMERVTERTYSYRPNSKYPDKAAGRFLEPRLARVKSGKTIGEEKWPFPGKIDLYALVDKKQQSYLPRSNQPAQAGSQNYRGGLGGGNKLPKDTYPASTGVPTLHTSLKLNTGKVECSDVTIPEKVAGQYSRTLEHLLDDNHGHFSSRHPGTGTNQSTQTTAIDTVRKAAKNAFQPGDWIWVEWDTEKKRVVSVGWHYYYRWAYIDTLRKRGWEAARHELVPLPEEKECDAEGAPSGLSPVRRLFGYTGENGGSGGIGKENFSQMMGRVAVNAALEVLTPGETRDQRFLKPTYLRELGMPRPSAVEHYLEQPYYPHERPSDQAGLVTYGDASGYDAPGKLAGRKFYLDRKDAYAGEPWKDDSPKNQKNDRSTLALDASPTGRHFRFTVRFRDLDPAELAAVLVALGPHQFRGAIGGVHSDGYCSKLGYARPLGWGSVRIDAKEVLILNYDGQTPSLVPLTSLETWVRGNLSWPVMLKPWLDIHRCKHPDAGNYPRDGNGPIFTYHAQLRSEHSRKRRYHSGHSQ